MRLTKAIIKVLNCVGIQSLQLDSSKRCPAPFVDDAAAWAAFKARLTAREGEIDVTREEIQTMVKEAVTAELVARDAVQAGAAQKVSPWAAQAWEKATGRGVFDGARPGGALTREQAAGTYQRMGLLAGLVGQGGSAL